MPQPSDCIAMATAQRRSRSIDVWDEVEDMTEALRKMQEEGSHTEEERRDLTDSFPDAHPSIVIPNQRMRCFGKWRFLR